MVEQSRILTLKNEPGSGQCVVYVMSRDQRVHDNHALLAAQHHAIRLQMPLVVCFNLLQGSGARGYEHFVFMLDGLEQVADKLAKLHIGFVMTYGRPVEQLSELFGKLRPSAVYFDFSPLKRPHEVAKRLANQLPAAFVVDTHNVVPAWVVSDKQEYAAHTFRYKVHKHLQTYLIEPDAVTEHPYELAHLPTGIDFAQARDAIAPLPRRHIQIPFTSGEVAAQKHLKSFIVDRLDSYATGRNDINAPLQSDLSPYLHYGQLSSLRVALQVMYASGTQPLLFDQAKMAQAGDAPSKRDGMNALYEEMIVRKELSDNYCLYAPDYTTMQGVPAWARQTLDEHRQDPRAFVYSREQLEHAQTHDTAWNAAQRQMLATGKMHGYMRMYWAKKILEWTDSPERALADTIYLNDAYSVDGGDPNGYVGILWSIAGLHDRPWTERSVFGKIRYMNVQGLQRKFDMQSYINRWSA